MRKSRIITMVVLLGFLAAVAMGQLYDAFPYGAPAPRHWLPGDGMPVEVSEFRGEIVVVPHSRSDDQQVISGLVKPRVRHLGNRQYLVGEDVATHGGGRSSDIHVTVWIPLENTSELFEYRSVEEARKVWDLGPSADSADETVEVIEDRS